MSDPDTQDRVEDLKAAASDAVKAIGLVVPSLSDSASVALMRETERGLRRALERFISDTQPLDVPPPRDTGES